MLDMAVHKVKALYYSRMNNLSSILLIFSKALPLIHKQLFDNLYSCDRYSIISQG